MKEQLIARQLSVGHGTEPLIHGLDLTLGTTELVSIIGRNGCGKSTLLRTLCGSRKPLAGQVHVAEHDVHAMAPDRRAFHIAALFPGRTTAGQVTVDEAVLMALHIWTGWTGRMSAVDTEMLNAAKKLTFLEGWGSRTVGTLSDGEHQRVMIARTIAQSTPFLLLDEPTAYLDLTMRVAMMRTLRGLASDLGRGVLISTHDLQLALAMSDRLVVVRRDGTCWQGSPQEAQHAGILAQEFDEDGVRFDPATGGFVPV